MKNNLRAWVMILVAVLLVSIAAFFLYRMQSVRARISQFGRYQGYTEKAYDGTRRISEYLTLSDGTRLAYDLILPTKDGVSAGQPLPVLFKYTPYLRAFTIFDEHGTNIITGLYNLGWKEKAMLRIRYWVYDRGHLMDPLFMSSWLEDMVKRGYVVFVVERRGTGASFGVMDPSFEVSAEEADEILDWIAAQEWCDGNIGMYGDSWEAQIQFAAASTGNPHLKAIFPTSSSLDNYSAVAYPGGIFNHAFASFFSWSTTFLESSVITPVDSDSDGVLLAQARAERRGSTVGEKSIEVMKQYPFRDSLDEGEKMWEREFALYPLIERINRAGIPIYMTNGWYDLFSRDMFLWYANLSVPKRLMVRPLDHSQINEDQFDVEYGAEAQRWFDYWLKGIENGIMDEPPIYYYVMGPRGKDNWQTTPVWPPAGQETTRLYLAEGRSGSVASANDGFLRPLPPDEAEAYDAYTVDYTTSCGQNSRWSAINWERDYPNMRPNDEKALTYTTPPLEADVQVVGHPIAHIWLVTGAPDLDMFVYLEEVDRNGNSTYITEGNLRTSHRSLSAPPFDGLGLPYHTYFESDLMPIPAGQPVELVFDLLPTAYRFPEGSRMRVTITFADSDSFETPRLDPAPQLRLLRTSNHPSFIEIPFAIALEPG